MTWAARSIKRRQSPTSVATPRRPYANHLVDDDALADGLADGSLVLDDRLTDALAVARTSAWRPTLDEDVALAAEFGTFLTADSIPRLTWRLDDLRGRLERLWRIPGPAP